MKNEIKFAEEMIYNSAQEKYLYQSTNIIHVYIFSIFLPDKIGQKIPDHIC